MAAKTELEQNNFADFVKDLRIDLNIADSAEIPISNEAPLASQTQKPSKKRKCSYKRTKNLSTSSQVSQSRKLSKPGDITEKIVRNLVINERTSIAAFSAKLVATNFFLTDENQSPELYHSITADTDWLSKATDHLILCRNGIVAPTTRGKKLFF